MKKISLEDFLKVQQFLQQIIPVFVLVGAFSLILIEPAHAAGLGGIESALQKIVDVLTGNVARLIAIIAVCILAFAWMFGFMDMRTAGQCILGIVVVFAAAEIVDMFRG